MKEWRRISRPVRFLYRTFGARGHGHCASRPDGRAYSLPPLLGWTAVHYDSVLRGGGPGTRREAPAGSSVPPPPKAGVVACFSNRQQNKEFCELLLGSHARERVVTGGEGNRGPEGRHNLIGRFFHSLDNPPHPISDLRAGPAPGINLPCGRSLKRENEKTSTWHNEAFWNKEIVHE